MMWGYGGYGSVLGWLAMGLFMLVCLVLFVGAAGLVLYLVARALRRDDALSVLRRQLAEGKVSEEEYRNKIELLARR